MPGMNKYEGKARRQARRRNYIAHDLGSDKYRQRVISDRRCKNDARVEPTIADRFYEEEIEYHDNDE